MAVTIENCHAIIGELGGTLRAEISTLQPYFRSQPQTGLVSSDAVKMLHDLVLTIQPQGLSQTAFDELLVDGFSSEQIWQQRKVAANECLSWSGHKMELCAAELLRKRKGCTEDGYKASKRQKIDVETAKSVDDGLRVEDGKEEDVEDSDDEIKAICNRHHLNDTGDDDDDDDEEEDGSEFEDEGENNGSEDGEDDRSSEKEEEMQDPMEIMRQSLKHTKKKNSFDEMNAFVDEYVLKDQKSETSVDKDIEKYMYDDVDPDDEEELDARNLTYSGFFRDPEGNEESAADLNKVEDIEDNNELNLDSELEEIEDDDEEEENEEEEEDDDDDDNDDDENDLSEDKSEGDDDQDEDTDDNDDDDRDVSGYDEEKADDKKDSQPSDTVKTAFKKRQEEMLESIKRIEDLNVAPKAWHLKGEATVSDRPAESLLTLLQDNLEYRFNSAPKNTENTKNTEELLASVKEAKPVVINFKRKVKPTAESLKRQKETVLDQQKSQQSLSQIYEDEFLRQGEKKAEEEDKEYVENRKMLDNLLLGLRMLYSHGHMPVRPPTMELKVIENVSSAKVEDAGPVCFSDAARLTAEEVMSKNKAELVGKSERTETNRKRERRLKKQLQHKISEEKAQKAASDPNSKEALEAAKKDLARKGRKNRHITVHDDNKAKKSNSSTNFFTNMQNQVRMHVEKKKEGGKNDAKKKKVPTATLR